VTGELVHTIASDAETRIEAIDLDLEHASVRRYRIRDDDPLSAEAMVTHRMGLRRAGWAVRVETETGLTATREAFLIRARLDAFEGDAPVRARRWDRRITRDGV
jgi:uncharacterized protein